jgi:hypothetical protein
MTTAQDAPALTSRLTAWIQAEGIKGSYDAPGIAARVIETWGPEQVEHWLACGDRDHGGSSYIVTFGFARESTFDHSGTAHLRHACLSLNDTPT